MRGANQLFILQPYIWLTHRLLLYNVGRGAANPFAQYETPANGVLPIHEFDLTHTDWMESLDGFKVPAYTLEALSLRRRGFRTRGVKAYFLPWGTNMSYRGRLGSEANFFFTPTLNGCTFSATREKNPLVVHSNYVNLEQEKIDQPRIDAALSQIHGHLPARRLSREDYKPQTFVGAEDYRVTIIGIRQRSSWIFVPQRYKVEPGLPGKLAYTAIEQFNVL